MKIKRNDKFICISTVIMDDGEIAYIEGKTYTSHFDECITDEANDRHHYWDDTCEVEKYFKKKN